MAAVQACAAVCVEGERRPGRWLWLRAVNQSFNRAAAWRELGGMEGGGGFAWHLQVSHVCSALQERLRGKS